MGQPELRWRIARPTRILALASLAALLVLVHGAVASGQSPDEDADGVADDADNCLFDWNPSQSDAGKKNQKCVKKAKKIGRKPKAKASA